MSKIRSTGNGIGFGGLLQVCFIVMKLAEIGAVATWSWWWVWSPTLIVLAVLAFIVIVYLVIMLFA